MKTKTYTPITCRLLTVNDAEAMAKIGFSFHSPHTHIDKTTAKEAVHALNDWRTQCILGAFHNVGDSSHLIVAMRLCVDNEKSPIIDFDAIESGQHEVNQLVEQSTLKLVKKILPRFKGESIMARIYLGNKELYANRSIGVLNALIGQLKFKLTYGNRDQAGFGFILDRSA